MKKTFSPGELSKLTGAEVYPSSITPAAGMFFFLARRGREKNLYQLGGESLPPGFEGWETTVRSEKLKTCPLTHANAEALRKQFDFTRPQLLGLKKSVGLGDRLGLAAAGHIRAVKGTGVAAVLAQQSIRELTRTRRTAAEVMDAAGWGAFQEGFREGFGADADHLKTEADVELCRKAGFLMFTIDPGDFVDDRADADEAGAIKEKYSRLPWPELEISAADCRRQYAGKAFPVGKDLKVEFSDETFARSAVKYLAAVCHTKRLYRYLAGKAGGPGFELEMSVDETATPTSAEAHYLVAAELKRLGVKWVSLAPRFVGRFEKGVDYLGDLKEFEASFAQHAAIARHLGPYKISIHSGSDKFSVYPAAARLAGGLVHVKTAGTSYLEALRVLARKAPALFREILAFARERYDTDKASYHVSAEVARVRRPEELKDGELEKLLDEFDARQVLHVTFGSVLTTEKDGGYLFRGRLFDALRDNEEEYYRVLQIHLGKHIQPFI